MRILMIEDEKLFGDKIAGSLRREGYEVDICYDGSSAMEHMSYESCDLILLDLNLPDIDGIEILRHLRSYDNETAVLILSARSQISDKVEGLDVGASDYLVKPFHLDATQSTYTKSDKTQILFKMMYALYAAGLDLIQKPEKLLQKTGRSY